MGAARCSFCGTTEAKGAKLIAGREAVICHACVVSLMEVVEAETSTGVSEGRILVRFPDGTSRPCEQAHAWRGLRHDGVDYEWCAAWTTLGGEPIATVAVRRRTSPRPIVGSTLPGGTAPSEEDARRLLDARGGIPSRRTTVTRPTPAHRGPPRRTDEPWFARLTHLGFISERESMSFLSQQYRVPTIDLGQHEIAAEIVKLVTRELCLRRRVMPVSRAGQALVVAMVDPTDAHAIDELATVTGYQIEPVIACEADITAAIARYHATE